MARGRRPFYPRLIPKKFRKKLKVNHVLIRFNNQLEENDEFEENKSQEQEYEDQDSSIKSLKKKSSLASIKTSILEKHSIYEALADESERVCKSYIVSEYILCALLIGIGLYGLHFSRVHSRKSDWSYSTNLTCEASDYGKYPFVRDMMVANTIFVMTNIVYAYLATILQASLIYDRIKYLTKWTFFNLITMAFTIISVLMFTLSSTLCSLQNAYGAQSAVLAGGFLYIGIFKLAQIYIVLEHRSFLLILRNLTYASILLYPDGTESEYGGIVPNTDYANKKGFIKGLNFDFEEEFANFVPRSTTEASIEAYLRNSECLKTLCEAKTSMLTLKQIARILREERLKDDAAAAAAAAAAKNESTDGEGGSSDDDDDDEHETDAASSISGIGSRSGSSGEDNEKDDYDIVTI